MIQSKSFVTLIGAAVSVVFVGGCTSFRAESFWGPAQKLSGLGASFAWRQVAKCEPDASKVGGSDIDATFHDLIEADLMSKGYRKSNDRSVDFSVCYRMGKRERQSETQLGTWDEATLGVELTDPSTGGLIWRGFVHGRIDYSAPPEARKARLETAVRQLLQPLPKAGSR